MRVLLTAHRFWPHVGGTEEVVASLARELTSRGHAVTVATSLEEGTPTEDTRDGYAIRRFPLKRVGKFRFPPKAYRDFVKRDDWDVVHLHGQRVWSTDYLYRHLGRLPAPVVFTAHGFYQYHMERSAALVNDYYYHVVLPRALKNTARVIALTGNEKRELTGWGVPSDQVTVVPDGFHASEFAAPAAGAVDFRAKFNLPTKDPLLLYVGGFYRNKRVDRLIETAAATNARLVVIGKDQDPRRGQTYCERLARRKGARVSFLGLLPREDVLAAYQAATLFVMASEFEGFGLVLLEAMASGLPFVALPAGAAPDLAAHGAGVVVDDTRAMTHAVQDLLRDDKRRAELAQAGRDAVASYDWAAVAARHEDLYEEALDH